MDAPRRITQKDVAAAAGVTTATVSLALRNHPDIPARTRLRIQKLATKLGYTPDPMLTALSRYRLRTRPARFRGNLAWLASTTPDYDWRRVAHFADYFEGACAQAARHGYEVSVIDLSETGGSWRRAGAVALARGITGLLLCPQPGPGASIPDLRWEKFSAVTFGYSLKNPDLHSVAPAQYQAALETVTRLHALGHRRIGFASIRSHDERTKHHFRAGYLAACAVLGLPQIPPHFGENWWPDETLRKWITDQRLDALVSCDISFARRIEDWSLPVPRQLSVACPLLPSRESGLSGMWEDNLRIGAAAVDFLVAMVQRDERGVPAHPQRLLIGGSWFPGKTTRRRKVT